MNAEEGGQPFWEQSPEQAKSLNGFLAAEAARDQGEKIFDEFVFALLGQVHQDKQPIDDLSTIKQAAAGVAGLDEGRLLRDMQKPDLRTRIRDDYQTGRDELGIFGTPTLQFPGGEPVFVKMKPPAPLDEAPAVFRHIRSLSTEQPYLQEIKKPRKP